MTDTTAVQTPSWAKAPAAAEVSPAPVAAPSAPVVDVVALVAKQEADAAAAAAEAAASLAATQLNDEADAAIEDENAGTVIVTAPKAFLLRLYTYGDPLQIRQGVQRVTQEVADHWYSKANGLAVFEG